MEEKKLDSVIRDTLYQASKDLNVSSDLHKKIHEEINGKSKEAIYMRHFGWKKLVVVAAALCIMGSMAAVAAGKIAYTTTGSSINDNQYPTFADLKSAETKLGYPVKAVEGFSNGYTYEKGNIHKVDAMDENQNLVTSYDDLWLYYQNSAGARLNFIVSKPPMGGDEPSVAALESRNIGDIAVSYSCDKYKFFPPDVTPSDEDLKAEQNGELYISYGSSEIETSYAYHVDWVQDGVTYSLMGMGDEGTQMGADEMFQMAKEVIEK